VLLDRFSFAAGAAARRLAWAVCLVGCQRAPIPEICPRIGAGDLVISELRGNQAGQDSFGHYIELYNTAGRTLDLQGVWIRQVALDGAETAFFIREPLEVADQDYAVIGPGLDVLPQWVDYGVGWDISGGNPDTGSFPRALLRYPAGFIDVESCGELIDRVFYPANSLPEAGTLACGNAEAPPDAAANDHADEGCWCVDDQPSDPNFPLPGLGLPGTPGRANRCP
jgi:hypothetical protein